MFDARETLEQIARTFNCVAVDDLSDHEADIAMILTFAGLLDMDKV